MSIQWEKWKTFTERSFLETELTFSVMDSGTLTYKGMFEGDVVEAKVSEGCLSDYDFYPVEDIASITQSTNVTLKVGGVVMYES